jgi:hypothetical protein
MKNPRTASPSRTSITGLHHLPPAGRDLGPGAGEVVDIAIADRNVRPESARRRARWRDRCRSPRR